MKRPGGWISNIGWVAMAGDLDPQDLIKFHPDGGPIRVEAANADGLLVIVHKWADGSVPMTTSRELVARRLDQRARVDRHRRLVSQKLGKVPGMRPNHPPSALVVDSGELVFVDFCPKRLDVLAVAGWVVESRPKTPNKLTVYELVVPRSGNV